MKTIEIDGLTFSVDEIKTKCKRIAPDTEYSMNYQTKIEYHGRIYKCLQFFIGSTRYMVFVREDDQGVLVRLADPVLYGSKFGFLLKDIPAEEHRFLKLIKG